MDEPRDPGPQSGVASFVAAALSVGITLTTLRSRPPPPPPPPLRVFNPVTGAGLERAHRLVLDTDPRTNRTVWELVDSPELHAGVSCVRAGAWIPPHAHPTEEVLLVLRGAAAVYDAAGHADELAAGAVVHVAAHARHAFRNVGRDTLVLAWVFPALYADKFHFQQRYAKPGS